MRLAYQPDNIIRLMWNKISGNVKVTFAAAFVTGLLVHIFILVNKLPNFDDLEIMLYDDGYYILWNLMLGRWFVYYPFNINNEFSIPWINGLLSIIYISVAVCLVVSSLKINQKTTCALIACMFVTFPTIASAMLFMFMADTFFFCLLLTCLTVFLAVRFKYGYLAAIVPLTLSMGIYQGLLSVAAGLLILVLIVDVMRNEDKWQDTLFKGFRFLILLSVSIVLYLIIVRLTTRGIGLAQYMNVSNMGKISISELPEMIHNSYVNLLTFFVFDKRNLHYQIFDYLFPLSFIACSILLVLWVIRQEIYRNRMKLLLLIVLLILFPLGCNLIYVLNVMDPKEIHILMVFGTVLVPVFMLIAADLHMNSRKDEDDSSTVFRRHESAAAVASNLSCWIIIATIAFSIFNYFVFSNQLYLKQFFAYEKGYAQHLSLVTRIQNLDGYQADTTINLVGYPRIKNGTPELDDIKLFGSNNDLFGVNLTAFLRRYLNVTQPIRWLRTGIEEMADEDAAETVAQMPIYPAYGSVSIIDGEIYVRFHDVEE